MKLLSRNPAEEPSESWANMCIYPSFQSINVNFKCWSSGGNLLLLYFPFFPFLWQQTTKYGICLCIYLQLSNCIFAIRMWHWYMFTTVDLLSWIPIMSSTVEQFWKLMVSIQGFFFSLLWDWVNAPLSWTNIEGMKWKCPCWRGIGGGRTCLFLQMEQSYASVSVSSFSSHRLLDLPPVTSVTPMCPRKPLADAEHRLN